MNRINTLLKKKNISIITCYDATFSNLLEQCKCDAVLVGDSLGIVIKGNKSTKKVSVDEMIYHTRAVRLGSTSLPIIADMPLLGLGTQNDGLINAKALINAGADMIKIEGGSSALPLIKFLSENKIKVCAHIGYIPQSMSSPLAKVDPKKNLAIALNLQENGAQMIVLSMMGSDTDKLITKNLTIPTIAFRSSNLCRGNVEIIYDLIGVTSKFLKVKKNRSVNDPKSCISGIIKFIENAHNKTTDD
jgi:3-methyl-2-oxobutanoate hydroxymethyltransferase